MTTVQAALELPKHRSLVSTGLAFWLPGEEKKSAQDLDLRGSAEPNAALALCCKAKILGWLPIVTLHRGNLDLQRRKSSIDPRSARCNPAPYRSMRPDDRRRQWIGYEAY